MQVSGNSWLACSAIFLTASALSFWRLCRSFVPVWITSYWGLLRVSFFNSFIAWPVVLQCFDSTFFTRKKTCLCPGISHLSQPAGPLVELVLVLVLLAECREAGMDRAGCWRLAVWVCCWAGCRAETMGQRQGSGLGHWQGESVSL